MSNRTITYTRFLNRVAPFTGVQVADLLDDDKLTILTFFNKAVRNIWERARWPDVCTIEARTPSSNVIAWEQSGETAIESVFAIWDVDPHGTVAPLLQTYDIVTSGVKLVGDDATTDDVYVWYRKQVPDFWGDDFSATASYSAGDQVFYSTTGDYYKALDSCLAVVPTNTSYWQRLTIPFRFVDYCVVSTYADWLRQDGQAQKAMMQDQIARGILDNELDRLERDEGYQTLVQVNTHLSNYDNT